MNVNANFKQGKHTQGQKWPFKQCCCTTYNIYTSRYTNEHEPFQAVQPRQENRYSRQWLHKCESCTCHFLFETTKGVRKVLKNIHTNSGALSQEIKKRGMVLITLTSSNSVSVPRKFRRDTRVTLTHKKKDCLVACGGGSIV